MPNNEDEILTQRITKLDWLAPVKSADQLPIEGIKDGAMCFVEGHEGEEEVWQLKNGTWIRIDML